MPKRNSKASVSAGFDYVKFGKSVAKIHKYWARKPAMPVSQLIKKYSRAGDLVLDPFCGSGTIGIESIALNRNYRGFDLNPMAIRIAEICTNPIVEVSQIREAHEALNSLIGDKIMDLYRVGDEYSMYTIVLENGNVESMLCDRKFGSKRRVIEAVGPVERNPIKIESPFGEREFPEKFYKDRFTSKGLRRISDFYTTRNLNAIEMISHALENISNPAREYLQIALSNSLLHLSKLKSKNIRPLSVNSFWLPKDPVEENAWWRFSERVNGLIQGLTAIRERFDTLEISGKAEISRQSALEMTNIRDKSIDYIFTDPPYGDVIQYSELSFIWNSFLGEEYENLEEFIVNPVQRKDEDFFLDQLSKFFLECNRVLKPGKYFTLCFHNRHPYIWISAAKSLYNAGFALEGIQTFPFVGNTYNKTWSKFSPKSDVYLTVKKTEKKTHSEGDFINLEDILKKTAKTAQGTPGETYDKFVENALIAIFNGSDITVGKSFTLERLLEDVFREK